MPAIVITNKTEYAIILPSWHTPPHDLCLTRLETALYPVDLTQEQYDQWSSSEPVAKLTKGATLVIELDLREYSTARSCVPPRQLTIQSLHKLPIAGEVWTDEYLKDDPDKPITHVGRVSVCSIINDAVEFHRLGGTRPNYMPIKDFTRWFVRVQEPRDRMRGVLEKLDALIQEVSDLDASCYPTSGCISNAYGSARINLIDIHNKLLAAFGPV
jgi:hypothetical protein